MSQIRMVITGRTVSVYGVSSAEPIEMLLYQYVPEVDKLFIAQSWTFGVTEKSVEVDEPKLLAACRSAYAQAREQADQVIEKQKRLRRFMQTKDEN